ncbi:MAG: D-glycero-beta-D-manno-heptose 1-phosphate adenylyltransferase [Nitrospirae bacterium]|nr:MAG: D-glycero-beta-D-manno-heptose 1-phosphate adenylyltransferase [Nitrospirota bacterium]
MFHEKIIKREEIIKKILEIRAEHRRIVFTNGCFDIIHIGHVRYLYEAKKLGDILIVGLNTDRSVSIIKPGRPIISEEQRMEVLASLEMVDYVTLFDEETPIELIKAIKPDVLVKGADWAIEDIVGREIAKEVYRIPYVEGISTTSIIEKIVRHWSIIDGKLHVKGLR